MPDDTDHNTKPWELFGDSSSAPAKGLGDTSLGLPPWPDAQARETPLRPADLVGARIGQVEIKSILGRGGFGTVFLGFHHGLARKVAVKFLHQTLDESAVQMFQEEAKVIAALDKHPNIVTVHDQGVYRGLPYFILEYVELNAGKLLERSPNGLRPADAVRIAAEIAEALGFVHEHGRIHLDVKPSNILIEAGDGRAKLADFGLVKAAATGASSSLSAPRGSPPYMSPEQIEGKHIDERSDVFSLGITLYELLCGRLPFEGATATEIIANICGGRRVPLEQRAADLPAAILDIVDRAMAHRRDDRYPDAGAFGRDCRAVLDALKPSADAPPIDVSTRRLTRKHKALLASTLSAAAVVLIVGVALALTSRPSFGEKLALANAKLEEGDAAGSQAIYGEVLARDARNVDARYGLGYARLQQGDIDDAQSQFVQIDDAALRREGEGAVAVERGPAIARERMKTLDSGGVTAYFETLAAKLDLLDGDYERVVERLSKLEKDRFSFNWQYGAHLETLGRALQAVGRLDEARVAYEALGASASGALANDGRDYIEAMERKKSQQELYAMLGERAQVIRARMDESGFKPATTEERWTSRPMYFVVREPKIDGGSIAAEYGLQERIPIWIERSLTESTPWRAVDRDSIGDVLFEQELSAMLASNPDLVQLQQLLGGRIGIYPLISGFGDQEILQFRLVDNETTESILTEEIDLVRPLVKADLIERSAEAVSMALRRQWPLRGRLSQTSAGLRIDLGYNVGVAAGDQFVVVRDHSTQRSSMIPGIVVVATQPIEADTAAVQIESPESVPVTVPEDGLLIVSQSAFVEKGR